MKNILAILGGIIVLLFIGLSILFITMFVKLGPLQEEAEVYARETIIAITTEWSVESAVRRASSEFLENSADGRLESVLAEGARAIGGLLELDHITCTVNNSVSTGEGDVTTGECTASGEHERGTAEYRLGVIKRNDEWKMQSFHFTAHEAEGGAVSI